MRALRFDGTLALATDEPPPTLGPDEALIALRMAGICQTDLELTRGYQGFSGILGHEFVGQLVTDAGPWRAGQRVVGEITVACGGCDFCQRGIPSQCRHRSTLGIRNYAGAFADLLRLPVRNLHAVPDSVADDEAVFAEPLAAAFQVTELAPVRPSDRVVLIGAGKLGLLIAQVLRLTGCDLSVIARQPRVFALLDKWGIDHFQQGQPEPQSVDVVVDATGNDEGFAAALDLVKPRGTIVLKSTYVGLPPANLTRVVVDEIKIVGSRCGPFPAALRMMQTRQVDLKSMIDACYPLDQGVTAFEHAAQRGVLKVLLTP